MKKILCICLLLLLLPGCNSDQREWQPDLVIPLETRNAQLILREWSFLLGSGAEAYYRENGEEAYLGKCGGADDGMTPFANGDYEIQESDGTLRIRWRDSDSWQEVTFPLPSW